MLLVCNYYVTYKCNAYCEFCTFADHSNFRNIPEAKLEDFRSNISQLSKLGVKFVDLTGGEPLLNKNIAEMAAFARRLRIQTILTTNTLLYKKFAEKLVGNVNLLHFSLDSPDEEEHNRIRKVDCYKKVFESIGIAKSLREFPDILFTVTNETYKKLPRMYDIAEKNDLVLIVNPVFSYFGNPGLSDEAVNYVEEFVDRKRNIYINKGFLKLRKHGGNHIRDPKCKAVSRVIVISPMNEIILPCYHFSNKVIKIDRPIKELRNSPVIKEYISMEGRFDFCEGCTVNCYFEPSFAFPTNYYGVSALSTKITYIFNKVVVQKIKRKFINSSETK